MSSCYVRCRVASSLSIIHCRRSSVEFLYIYSSVDPLHSFVTSIFAFCRCRFSVDRCRVHFCYRCRTCCTWLHFTFCILHLHHVTRCTYTFCTFAYLVHTIHFITLIFIVHSVDRTCRVHAAFFLHVGRIYIPRCRFRYIPLRSRCPRLHSLPFAFVDFTFLLHRLHSVEYFIYLYSTKYKVQI